METCENESCDRRNKHLSQNNSTTDTTRISFPTSDSSSEKASSSSSSAQCVVSEESTSRNNASRNSSSFEGGLRCRNNNKGCVTSASSPGQQCSNRLTTGQLKDTESCPCSTKSEQDPTKNRESIQDVERNNRSGQHALQERSTQQRKISEYNYSLSRDNAGKKTAKDNTMTTSSYNNDMNNEDVTSAPKSSNHRHHKITSYQQQHHNHHHHSSSSSSSYEHKQHSTQQNQTGHRRHLHHHHHHNRHKNQRNPAQIPSDSAATPTASRRSLHRHHHNDGETNATARNHYENPDFNRNNDTETSTNHSQDKDNWTCNTVPTITSSLLDRNPKALLTSHRPSKKSLYTSSQLIPSRASLSPPLSSSLSDGPSLSKRPRVSTPLSEMTDIDSETSACSEAHIHSLFPELLVMIFCYLDVRDKGRAAQVCVRWRDAAYTRTVWRGVEAKIHLRRSNPSLFRSLAKRGIRRIQILSLKRSLRDVVAGIPDLESLNLSGCYNITDAGLGQALLHRLLTVHELNLSLCKQITDYSLSRIAIYLKNLRVLHLGGCSVITNAGLFVISYGLVKLKSLDLRSCRDLSDQGIAHLAGLGDEVTHQGNLALEHLCLQDCQKLTDQALRYISIGLKNLTKVNLSFCGGVTDAGLQYLAKMPSLRKINLASCDQVTDAGLAHLARGGSRITSLDVSFCDKIGDWGLSCLAGGLFNLECLSLSACNISDNGISHIVQTMHGLTTLNIGQCHRITDRGLNLIADNLKKLSRMDLYGCTQISAKGLERIMQLPSLSSLNLGLWHKR